MRYILILLALTACKEPQRESDWKDDSQTLKAGRFEVKQISDMRRDQILVDTATGQIWHMTCMVSNPKDKVGCDYTAWMKDDIEGINADKNAIYSWAKTIEESSKK